MKDGSKTSWGPVAEWYGDLLQKEGTYQKELVLPNLLRLLQPSKHMTVLDLACGPGLFAREFAKSGARVIGVDVSRELIARAKKDAASSIEWHVAPAHKLSFITNASVDLVMVILAIQNIENVHDVLRESSRVLKSGGRLAIVLNHPAFRIPQRSSWEWDAEQKEQYRRIDGYMSESKTKIQMHPGDDPRVVTISYHRPLELYCKALAKAGFRITHLEEWLSHKKSEPGPRASAENRMRKEIPLFLYMEAGK